MMSDGTFRYLPARLRHGAWELRLGQGSKELDASLLLLPAIGFLRPHDVRIRGTVAAIGRGLLRNGLVLRYDTGLSDDSLPAGEGVFLACSFWLADAYLMLGR